MAGCYHDVLETVSKPDYIFEGNIDEIWAIQMLNLNKALIVIYKEQIEKCDGFIITLFLTSKIEQLLKRKLLWKR